MVSSAIVSESAWAYGSSKKRSWDNTSSLDLHILRQMILHLHILRLSFSPSLSLSFSLFSSFPSLLSLLFSSLLFSSLLFSSLLSLLFSSLLFSLSLSSSSLSLFSSLSLSLSLSLSSLSFSLSLSLFLSLSSLSLSRLPLSLSLSLSRLLVSLLSYIRRGRWPRTITKRDNLAQNEIRSSKTDEKVRFWRACCDPYARNEVRSSKLGKIAILMSRRRFPSIIRHFDARHVMNMSDYAAEP